MDNLNTFQRAARKVKEVTLPTPLVESPVLSRATGNQVYLKPENMQRTGAYKVRGAYYKISTLTDEERARGLITASAGNHAQGVARAAQQYSARAVVVMPETTPPIKISRTEALGAEVVLSGQVFDEAFAHAQKLAEEQGLTMVHPFDDLDVACGQGSVAMEIFEELPEADVILVPVGGGGLAAGVSTAAKMINPDVKVIGVEPAGAACMKASLEAGEVVCLPEAKTIADGTAVLEPGHKVFPYVQKNLDGIITIPDEELIPAFLDMVENHKMVVENSGLLTVAALSHLPAEGKNVVAILSGGNMDVITMSNVVQLGLIARDRIFTVSIMLPDRPGALVSVSQVIAANNGNVVRLVHNQFATVNRNDAVELRVTIEAFGTEHKQRIIEALRDEGLNVQEVEPSL